MSAKTPTTIDDSADLMVERVGSVLVNSPNTSNVCPNAGLHLHCLARPSRNVEHGPIGISTRHNDCT